MNLKVAHVPLNEWPKFRKSGPIIKEVRMNKVKVNKAKTFSHFLRKWRHYGVNGQEKWGGDNPSRKLQTILSIVIEEKKYIFAGPANAFFD